MALFNLFKSKYADLIPIVFRGDITRKVTDKQILSATILFIENKRKIAEDCVRLINTTKTPAVFFSRYIELLEMLEELSKIEHHKEFFKGVLPSQNKREILSKINETQLDFIDRYWNHLQETNSKLKTEKAKAAKTRNWFEILDLYNEMLTDNSKIRIQWLKSNVITVLE